MKRLTILLLLTLGTICMACGGGSASSPPTESTAETETTTEDPPPPEVAERPTMTADECTAAGGTMVGDIGDGAIHRPEYRCENGQPPIATVPLGIEGSVCCGP